MSEPATIKYIRSGLRYSTLQKTIVGTHFETMENCSCPDQTQQRVCNLPQIATRGLKNANDALTAPPMGINQNIFRNAENAAERAR